MDISGAPSATSKPDNLSERHLKYRANDVYMIGRKDMVYDYPHFDSKYPFPMTIQVAREALKNVARFDADGLSYKLYRVSIEEV
jgi:hypothetical protein